MFWFHADVILKYWTILYSWSPWKIIHVLNMYRTKENVIRLDLSSCLFVESHSWFSAIFRYVKWVLPIVVTFMNILMRCDTVPAKGIIFEIILNANYSCTFLRLLKREINCRNLNLWFIFIHTFSSFYFCLFKVS